MDVLFNVSLSGAARGRRENPPEGLMMNTSYFLRPMRPANVPVAPSPRVVSHLLQHQSLHNRRLPARITILVMLAMVAFAANSLLCRMALKNTGIDARSFTAIRIISGAVVLWLIVRARNMTNDLPGSWLSALALFVYAAGFSFAYVKMPAAVGALILFGAVQATMIGYGMWCGERMRGWQVLGFCAAFAGLIALLLPGLSSPPAASSALMLTAGVAWGIYSLRGKGLGNPMVATAGNFMRAVPFAALLYVSKVSGSSPDGAGIWYAVLSGGLASGVGYALWYAVLPGLKATNAATIQLSVPVIAAVGGVIFLGETITLRLLLSSAGILGGIALVIMSKNPPDDGQQPSSTNGIVHTINPS